MYLLSYKNLNMFYVSKISLELWVNLEANNLKSYIQRLKLIHFKVINFCMSTYDFDVFILFVMFSVTTRRFMGMSILCHVLDKNNHSSCN